jgi:hypothetical protein
VSFSWMPRAEADRWVVATAFATLVATVVATGVGWWAGQETPAPPATADQARQSVHGSAIGGGITQVSGTGGNVLIRRSPSAGPPSAPPALPAAEISPTADGQSVHGTSVAGPVDQVQGTGGDVEIEGV